MHDSLCSKTTVCTSEACKGRVVASSALSELFGQPCALLCVHVFVCVTCSYCITSVRVNPIPCMSIWDIYQGVLRPTEWAYQTW